MLQVCNKPYREPAGAGAAFDDEVHITNVSRNADNAELFVEERPADVAVRYPAVFGSAAASLVDLVRLAAPFLRNQRSPRHFELLGMDFLGKPRSSSRSTASKHL